MSSIILCVCVQSSAHWAYFALNGDETYHEVQDKEQWRVRFMITTIL